MEATANPVSSHDALDPRIRRTRDLLAQALDSLLKTKDFEKISVQDITDAATVNRATFYAHYPDKFALLECMVAGQFHALLAERNVHFDGTCSSALLGLILGVCDFLAKRTGSDCERHRQMEPHMEAAIVTVVRKMVLDGLQRHPSEGNLSPELQSAMVSWAIYGAAKEWVRTANRVPSEEIAGTVLQLLLPVLHPSAQQPVLASA